MTPVDARTAERSWPTVRPARRAARVWPALVLALVPLALFAAGGGFLAYAGHQWRMAQAAVRDGRAAEARDRLAVCLRLWPRSVEAHLLAARAARLDMDFEAAEAHLNRCLKLSDGATEAVQLEFLLLRAQAGEADEVAGPLLKCVEENHPETPVILETLGRYYMHHLEYGKAYACLTRWAEYDPAAAKPYHWRGFIQERLNNHKHAMQDYLKALELDPGLTPVRLRVAEMLLEDKQPLEALAHLERLLRESPGRAHVKALLGQCRFLQGEHDEARRLLEEVVAELPKDPPVLLCLGKIDVMQGRAAEAEAWLRRLLELDPTDTEAHYNLAAALNLQERRAEARAEMALYEKYKVLLERHNRLLREETERPSNDPARAWEIGRFLLEVGREQNGLHWLFKALERDPGHRPTHQTLAEHFERKNDREKAAVHRRWLGEPGGADPRTKKAAAGSAVRP